MYVVCNTTVCALKQPRDFCCVCVEAKEVPALLVVKMWEELGLACCEQQSLWASRPLGGEEGKLDMVCGSGEGLKGWSFHGTACAGACPWWSHIT